MNVKVVFAILLIAVPLCAQAQSPSVPKVTKGDAQKVATIIRSDKAKTQANCEINRRLEKILGPEYIALMDGLQKLGQENSKRVAEILLQFAALNRLCTK